MSPRPAPVSAPDDDTKVLVVDDHLLLAETMVAALTEGQRCAVRTAKDVDEALAVVEEAGQYDAILLDYDVPGMNSLEGLRQLIDANGGRVALFSGTVNWTTVELALDQGASGFIPKTLPLKTLGHAIRLIADGEVFLPVDFLRRTNTGDEAGFALKPREKRVLALLCEGMQNKEIGRELEMEEVIVKMDVKSICRKLGVRNRTHAVIMAHKHRIL